MPLAKSDTDGKCGHCGKIFSWKDTERHVAGCFSSERGGEFFHICAVSPVRKQYWMHAALAKNAKLSSLDGLFRKVWMECCGHLSCFQIGKNRYTSSLDDEYTDEHEYDMQKTSAVDVLSKGMKFTYEYDFGSTTELLLEVVDGIKLELTANKRAAVLMRNEKPTAACNTCGKPARFIAAEGISDDDDATYCTKCSKEIGEDELLPLVNSPRTGQCGYRGKPYD